MCVVPKEPDDARTLGDTASDVMLRDLQELAGQLFMLKETMLDQVRVVEVMARVLPLAGGADPAAAATSRSAPGACRKDDTATEQAANPNETDAYYLID
jgi:hypothetical protein